ncbi:glycerophosphodiester phosphodiesterase family protein [Marinobacterium sp. YM272]|uniref:glycerophosphodiester phosphodiesterase family protein n=1 Tax=Marinobacterium sp. YM272 TaxID=3421654 RepID=UPI003D7FD470
MNKPELPTILGHRGIASLAPENTLGAVREAARQGVRWVEMDVSLLADDTPVIYHDDSLDRLSDRRGVLAELRLDELADVNVAAHFDGWGREPLPTLKQMLRLLQEQGLGFNLEIKDQGLDPGRVVKAIARDLAGFDPAQMVISSFNYALLEECRRQLPVFARGLLCEQLDANWRDALETLDAFSLHCFWQGLDESAITQAKAAGYKVLAWTVNDVEKGRKLLQLGVDALITDLPQGYSSVA